MDVESRWIMTLILTGALFATLFHNGCNYLVGNTNFTTIVICVAFFVAIISSPTYRELSDYWRKRYGK